MSHGSVQLATLLRHAPGKITDKWKTRDSRHCGGGNLEMRVFFLPNAILIAFSFAYCLSVDFHSLKLFFPTLTSNPVRESGCLQAQKTRDSSWLKKNGWANSISLPFNRKIIFARNFLVILRDFFDLFTWKTTENYPAVLSVNMRDILLFHVSQIEN